MTVTPIVALDAPDLDRALGLADLLGESCDFYKVGSELFTGAGPESVRALRARGSDVFLDLKLHDIPRTVRAAAQRAASLGARLLTVHVSGGRSMVEAAVEGAGAECGVLGVTVLTSLSEEELAVAWGRKSLVLREEVLRLAEVACEAKAYGVVCSGEEAAHVRAAFGDALRVLVPGVRLPGGARHDQVRVVTPAKAQAAGATYIVLGRAVTDSESPAQAMAAVRRELAG